MAGRLEGKIALIAGAGCIGPGWGNGRAAAVIFAKEGAKIFAVDKTREPMRETLERIAEFGGDITPYECDVTDNKAVAKMVEACLKKYGRIDILLNNVGGSAAGGAVELSEEGWQHQLDYNLTSVFLTCKHVLPVMERQGGGAIVNTASTSAIRHTGANQIGYAASKAGVVQFSRVTAIQYATKGIRVNTVLPGQMHTPMVEARLAGQRAGGDVEALLKQRLARIPMGFMGDGAIPPTPRCFWRPMRRASSRALKSSSMAACRWLAADVIALDFRAPCRTARGTTASIEGFQRRFLIYSAVSLPLSGELAVTVDELCYEIALANRMLDQEGVLDAFGHVSARHPTDPNRYLLSRSRAPGVVETSDILEYTLDSEPVSPPKVPLYSERVIHGEIYKARPDVMAVCHHHSPAFMPLVITGTDYVPVFHLGAIGGVKPPFWDQHDEFGDTNLLVAVPAEGASLARALGKHWMVLMNRHGVTVAGNSVRDCVFRCIYSHFNADYQVRAAAYGKVDPLTAGEAEKGFGISKGTTGQSRAWEYWTARLDSVGRLPPKR